MFFYTFIPKLLNMSLTASIAIVIVMLLRLLLKKVPKVISYALWAVILFRLLCPISIGTDFSIYNLFDVPSDESGMLTSIIEYVPSDIVHAEYSSVSLPIPGVSDMINEALPQRQEQLAADPFEAPISIATYIWMAGVLAMVIYSVVSYLKIRKKLSVTVPLRENIFIADDIKSPFVIGLFRPKIYLPCNLGEKEQTYIILHEQHHIRRFDHIVKALAFFALVIHWFNPLVWLAFTLAGRNMEMSCDEAVIQKMGSNIRADYSASLLTLATGRRIIAGTPLAFGEGDTRRRINNLSKWKKPTFWVVLLAVVVCAILAISLLTNPAAKREFPINGSNVSSLDTERVVEMIAKVEKLDDGSQLCINEDSFDLMFTSDFEWANDGAIRFYYLKDQKTYSAQLRMFHDDNKYFITDSVEWVEQEHCFKLFHYLDAIKYMPQEEIQKLSPDADGFSVCMRIDGVPGDYDRVLKYSQNGVEDIDGWYIHLEVQPLHKVEGGAYNGSGDELIHLFYGHRDLIVPENNSVTKWFDYLDAPVEMEGGLTTELPEYPGVTFQYTKNQITASKPFDHSDLTGHIILIDGMPIWNAYFTDLTGDGLPDICATYTYGSGIIDSRIVICDYANGASYTLEDRSNYDYSLWLNENDGQLYVNKCAYPNGELVSSGRLIFKDNCIQIANDNSENDPLDTAISKAILEHYRSDKPDGLIHVESHVLLANEMMCGTPKLGSDNHTEKITAYLLVYHVKYSTYGGKLEEKGGSYIPTAITFKISSTEEYILEEYWEPRDGIYYAEDIRNKFPGVSADDALNDQAYIEELKAQIYSKALTYLNNTDSLDTRIAELLDEISASPSPASKPDMYLDIYLEAHEPEYQELLRYGEYTLHYCFTAFLHGGQTDLRGQIMALACQDIMLDLGEGYAIDQNPVTGQDWFESFLSNAKSLTKQFSREDLEKNFPASFLLLQLMDNIPAVKDAQP